MNDSEIVDLYLNRDEDAIEQSKMKYHAKLRTIAQYFSK